MTTRDDTDGTHNDGNDEVKKKCKQHPEDCTSQLTIGLVGVANVNMMQSKHRLLANISREAS